MLQHKLIFLFQIDEVGEVWEVHANKYGDFMLNVTECPHGH